MTVLEDAGRSSPYVDAVPRCLVTVDKNEFDNKLWSGWT